MKWTPGYRSDDVEVREGEQRRAGGLGGAGGGLVGSLLPFVISRFGLPGLIVLGVGYFLFTHFIGGSTAEPDSTTVTQTRPATTGAAGSAAKDDPRVQFVSFVLDDIQGSWTKRFAAQGKQYQHAKLVLFTNATPTACGYGESATGPFYCPRDRDVYLDLGFFNVLAKRLGANGDFAQAYVIAHEVGHHVQNQLGLTEGAMGRGAVGASGASVKLELQADCLAGIWAHDTAKRDLLEGGDLDEALTAAGSIGDDTLQRNGQGSVRPETFTHGTSAQRVAWFKKGYTDADLNGCDTSRSAMP